MSRAKGRRAMAENKDTEFFNIFDGVKGRPDSQYLDMAERVTAEKLRAQAEGREPETDLGKLPASVGTPLVIEAQRVDNLYSNPPVASGVIEAKDVDPVSTLEVSVGAADPDIDLSYAAQVANERRAQEDALSDTDAADDDADVDGPPSPDNENFSADTNTYLAD